MYLQKMLLRQQQWGYAVAKLQRNTAAAIGGLGLATGFGAVGGGVANIGNMAGLAIDPEAPGSSNTMGSRMSMQT